MWLTDIAKAVLRVGQIVLGFVPAAQTAFPGQSGTINTVASEIQSLVQVVATIEAIDESMNSTLTSEQKINAAIVLAGQVIGQSPFMLGKKIQDESLYNTAIHEFAQGAVDLAKSLHSNIETKSLT